MQLQPTRNMHLQPIDANRRIWADIMNGNLSIIDAIVGSYFVVQNLQGVWQNSTAYMAGQTVIDVDTSVVYLCQVDNVSSSIPTTFEEERALYSTYWSVYSSPARARGAWMADTAYALNDFVVNGAQYAVCIETHISSSSFETDRDAGKWSILVDLSQVGSQVLPVPGGLPDANKFVITPANGLGYSIYTADEALAKLGGTSIGIAVLRAASQAAARDAIGAQITGSYQPAGSYQPLAAPLTSWAALTTTTQRRQYLDVYSLNVKTFGATGGSSVDDTTAINNALALGGHVIVPTGSYKISNLTIGVAGTVLEMQGGATFIDATSTTGALITVTANNVTIRDLRITVTHSPNLSYSLRVIANYFKLDGAVLNGKPYNPLLPNSLYEPLYNIHVGDTTHHYVGNRIDDVTTRGGNHGVVFQGGDQIFVSNADTSFCVGFGIIIGNTLPSTRWQVNGHRAVCTGFYGISISNVTSNASFQPHPIEGGTITNAYYENCGWGSYYVGQSGSVGTPKLGADLTSTGHRNIYFQGTTVNCGSGGVEAKFTQLPAITLTPRGMQGITIDLKNFVNYDPSFLCVGWSPVIGSSGPASTDASDILCRGSSLMTTTPVWKTGYYYKPWDMVSAGGSVYQCFGDANGQPGLSGASGILGSGVAETLQLTVAAVATDTTFTFADASNIIDGMQVFAGPKLPDGCTVLSHTATTVTIQGGAMTGPLNIGESIIFAQRITDGNLNWLVFATTDTSATPEHTIGMQVTASTNVTADIVVSNHAYGLQTLFYNSTDSVIYDLKVRMIARNCNKNGVIASSLSGTGGFSNFSLEGEIESTESGLQIAGVNTTNTRVSLRNLKVVSDSYAIQTGGGDLEMEISNCDLYGGLAAVIFDDATYNIVCKSVRFSTGASGGNVCRFDGTGSWQWGASSEIYNGNPSATAGWSNIGSMSVDGRVLRTDLTTAPSSGTVANVNEYMVLSAPTSTIWGYHCQASDLSTMTWKKYALTA